MLTPETFEFLGSYTKYGEFLDGQDGYWYGFSNEGNSSGDALMLWIKISKTDYSFTEGQWTLSNAKLMDVGTRALDSFPERSVKCCIRAGICMCLPMTRRGSIRSAFPTHGCDTDRVRLYVQVEALVRDWLLRAVPDAHRGSDHRRRFPDHGGGYGGPYPGERRLNNAATPLFQYKNFLIGWGGSYGNEYRRLIS